MPRSTVIESHPVGVPIAARSLLSLSERSPRLSTLTLTSGGYPMFTGLTMSAMISSAEKKHSTRKMLKLTGISLR